MKMKPKILNVWLYSYSKKQGALVTHSYCNIVDNLVVLYEQTQFWYRTYVYFNLYISSCRLVDSTVPRYSPPPKLLALSPYQLQNISAWEVIKGKGDNTITYTTVCSSRCLCVCWRHPQPRRRPYSLHALLWAVGAGRDDIPSSLVSAAAATTTTSLVSPSLPLSSSVGIDKSNRLPVMMISTK